MKEITKVPKLPEGYSWEARIEGDDIILYIFGEDMVWGYSRLLPLTAVFQGHKHLRICYDRAVKQQESLAKDTFRLLTFRLLKEEQ